METIQHTLTPTFGGSFDHGWKTMSKYFLILLLVVFVTGIIMAPTQLGKMNLHPGDMNFEHFKDWNFNSFNFNSGVAALTVFAFLFGIFALAYTLLIVPIFNYGANLIFVHAVRDIRPQFETLIIGFKQSYLHIVLANLLTTALVMMGMIFLIIPGIIIGCRLAFVSYLVMDKKRDPIVAVEESWKLTKGHGWTIFFMGVVSFFIVIFGLCLCFVGIYPALIWVKSSWASMYEAVLIEKDAKSPVVE